MFDQLFRCPKAIKRHFNAPLLEERLRYLHGRAERGAAKNTLKRIAALLLVITNCLDLENKRLVTIEEIERAADRRARRRPKVHSTKGPFSKEMRSQFIFHAKNLLRMLDRLQEPTTSPVPFSDLIEKYIHNMRYERGLSEATIYNRCAYAQEFLIHVCQDHPLEKITAIHIDDYLQQKRRQYSYARGSLGVHTSSIRAFFRYAEECGWCQRGLADTIQGPRIYRYENLPASPTWENVRDLLASTTGNGPSDIRDRAILLLLATYGLRAGEVRKLRLEDIDWDKRIIHIRRSKSRKVQQYPLCQTVGNTILRYLKKVRPRSHYREVFLSIISPIHPLGRASLYRVVSRRWKLLRASLEHHGPHSLRHACATRLINRGVSLKEIGDHLGHRSLDTTRIYAKVDLSGLREVARFDMGGIL